MTAIGHNNSADMRARLDVVRSIVQSELPAAQKLLAIAVAVLAGDDGSVTLGAEDMKRIASTSKRDTVFAAKKAIAEKGLGIVSTETAPGKSNSYRMMPPSVVAEIVEAYRRTRPVPQIGTPTHPPKRDVPIPQNGTSTRPPNRDVTHPETGDVPIPKNGTGSALVPARAYKELPSEVVIFSSEKPPLSPMPTFGYGDRATFENGQIILDESLRAFWLERFEGDSERLDLALIQAAGYVQPNNRSKPLEAQVGAQLARAVSEKRDRDKRYEAAVQNNAKGGQPKEGSTNRTFRIAKMLEDQEAHR